MGRSGIAACLSVSTEDAFLRRAERARKKLSAQYLYHPDVKHIDIGYAYEDGRRTNRRALRIHVRKRWTEAPPQKRTTSLRKSTASPSA